MEKLKKSKFEVLVLDLVIFCGDIIVLKLGILFMYFLRFFFVLIVEKYCGKVLYFFFYVFVILLEFND